MTGTLLREALFPDSIRSFCLPLREWAILLFFLVTDCMGRRREGKGTSIDSFCAWDGDTLVLNILGSPSAQQDEVGGVRGKQLCVSVTEKPVAGRATDHMVRFLAGQFGVEVGDIEVVFGRYNVNKQLRIRSPSKLPEPVSAHLMGS